jgi:hypothetical protein
VRPLCYDECHGLLQSLADLTPTRMDVGLCPDVVVEPPGFPPFIATCPHGVRWLAEPTSEQIAQWRADRAP